jgi:hypothetical protein
MSHEFNDFVASVAVEVRRRLVGQHERGCSDEGARDRDTLLLAA